METLVEIKKRLENDEIVELIFEGISGKVETNTRKSVTERAILTKGKHINAPFVLGKEEELFVIMPIAGDPWGLIAPTCSFRIDPLRYSEIPQMLPAYMRKELEEFEDERAKYAYALLLFLVTQDFGFRISQRALRLIEEDNRLRAQHMNKELEVVELVDIAKQKMSVYKIEEGGLTLQELQALVDVVLRVTRIENTDYVAVAGIEEIAKGVRETFSDFENNGIKIATITPRRIQELLGVDRKSAWRIKEQIEGLAEKKIIAKSATPIRKGDLVITHFAITPLIEHHRSPLRVKWGEREGVVRIFRIDPYLQDKAWTWTPYNPFTRIARLPMPNNAKQFVAHVYLFLLNHRHDYTAYLSLDNFAKSFPSKWSKSRHKGELVQRVEGALGQLKEVGLIVDFERKEEGWRVELR